jgi:hypothetical protein
VSGGRWRRGAPSDPAAVAAGQIRLGNLERGSVAPAVFGLIDRGAMKRPEVAADLACQVELRMTSYPPVRITFSRGAVLVEDAPRLEPLPQPEGQEGDLAELASQLEEPGDESDEPAFVPDPDTRERAATFRPDVVVSGSLPDVVAIMATPLMAGLPSIRDPRGRSVLASIAGGRVRFRGSPRLVRRLLRLLQI